MSEPNIILTQREKDLIMSSRQRELNSSHPALPQSQTHSNPDNADGSNAQSNGSQPSREMTSSQSLTDHKMEDFDWADEPHDDRNQQDFETEFTTSTKYGATRVMSPDEALRRRQANLRSANELFEATKNSKKKTPTAPFHYDRFAVRNSPNVTPPLSQRTDVHVTESPTHIGGAPKVPAYLIKETKNKRQLANAGIYTMDGARNVALP